MNETTRGGHVIVEHFYNISCVYLLNVEEKDDYR